MISSLQSLALAYAVYFAALGIMAPYWNLYLKSLAFSATTIGTVSSLIILTRIVAAYGWSWLADVTGRPVTMIRFCSLATVLVFSTVYLFTSPLSLGAVMMAWAFTLAACLPQIETLTLKSLGEHRDRYGAIRVWGSVGFVVSVFIGGIVIAQFGVGTVPTMLLIFYGLLAIVCRLLPDDIPSAQAPKAAVGIAAVIRKNWLLFLVCFLMQASHAPFYTFFSIYLTDLGYTGNAIGSLWSVGVICEIGVFLSGARMMRVLQPELILTLSFFAAMCRWLMLGFYADQTIIVLLSQMLHGLTFGACHGAAIQIVHRHFSAELANRGQALYASLTFGVGIALGSYLSGVAWDSVGPTQTFVMASIAAGLAGVLSIRLPRTQS